MWVRGRRAGPTPPAGRGCTLAGAPVGTKDRKAVLTLALVTANVGLSREKHPSLQHPPPPSICCLLCLARGSTTDSTASRTCPQLPPFRRGKVSRSPAPALTGSRLPPTQASYSHCADLRLLVRGLHRVVRQPSWSRLDVGTTCSAAVCIRHPRRSVLLSVDRVSVRSDFSLVYHGMARPAMQAPSSG